MRDQASILNCPGGTVSAASDNTAVVSPIVDRLGFDSLTFFIVTGTLVDADATFTVLVEDSDASNMTPATAVADGDLVPADPASTATPEEQASFTFAADGAERKIGYRGTKRYVRLTVTPANNTGAAPIAVVPVLGAPARAPVAA